MTFSEWFGKDLTGQTYDKSIWCPDVEITSLKGCPEIINGDFDCSGNLLRSLEYGPKIVKGDVDVSFNLLRNMVGCPEVIDGRLDCASNILTSLKGCPDTVKSFFCQGNWLTSLNGSPRIVEKTVSVLNGNLKTLDGLSYTNGMIISDFSDDEIKKYYKLHYPEMII